MKKYSKQDYINIFLIIASFLVIFLFLLFYKGTSYASRIDYSYQHYMIPEYFRTLFYETKEFFPSYAFNLGMGQNIYNFSYYGLLSPIVLLSYLLPFLKMKTYLQIASLSLYIVSIVLCYMWISTKTEDKRVRFISTFLYSMSGPLILHTHRHIMFMCYIPFVFLALFGVEKYVKERKPYLLIVSLLLIIISSYFFSVPALIAIFIYGIYLYLENNKKLTIKDFIKSHALLAYYFIIPILISGVLLLPSFKAILNNRYKEATEETILTYLIPSASVKNVLYGSYSMGLTSIFIISVVYLIVKKSRNTKFLGIIFSLLICFPIFNYILNGFMYINGKVFIPFLPLGILAITITLQDLIIEKEKATKTFLSILLIVSIIAIINNLFNTFFIIDTIITTAILLLTNNKKNSIYLLATLVIFSTLNCIRINLDDDFNNVSIENNQYNSEIKEILNRINENDIYRTVDLTNKAFNSNNIRDINEYKTTMYSSITNKYYKDFYWNTFDTDNPSRNDAIYGDISNPLFNIYFGNKYLIGDNNILGYNEITSNNNINLYENNDAFSIGYVNNNLMSKEEFNKLDYPYSIEALLNYTIVDKPVESNYKTKIKKIELSKEFSNLKEKYNFYLNKNKNVSFKTKRSFSNQMVIIKFNMNYSESCSQGDTAITINNVKNVLTCKTWKYHNHNYSFTYILSEPETFNIDIEKGHYDISDIDMYTLDYNDIKSINSNHSNFIIDKKMTKGDYIKGHIDVKENGYFSLSIPYDKGYNIYVDKKEKKYEIVNKSFIGFKIENGSHNIVIKYTSPWLKTGKIVSIIGICLLLITIGYKGVKKHEKNIDDSTLL